MKFFTYFRALSLDVVAGACICSAFIARQTQVTIDGYVIAALGIAVWLIYTADHLWDARKIAAEASTFRHQFHQHYSKYIIASWVIVAFSGTVIVFFLPQETVLTGGCILLFVLFYFLIIYTLGSSPSVVKELIIAILYTAGIFAGSVSAMDSPIHTSVFYLIGFFIATALINLLLISMYELAIDEKERHTSLARYIGYKPTQFITAALLVFCILLFISSPVRLPFTMLFMTLGLALILFFPSIFRKNERYRVLGDGIFILPIVNLL